MMLRILTILCVVVAFTSCNSDDLDDSASRELNTNRQLWESSKVKNYSWNESVSCFCAGVLDRDIFVVDGVKDRVAYDESNFPSGQNYDEIFEDSKTVEEAFDFITSLLQRELASLVIEYDTVYGFPKIISIDYAEGISDDEIVYTYSNFNIEN